MEIVFDGTYKTLAIVARATYHQLHNLEIAYTLKLDPILVEQGYAIIVGIEETLEYLGVFENYLQRNSILV